LKSANRQRYSNVKGKTLRYFLNDRSSRLDNFLSGRRWMEWTKSERKPWAHFREQSLQNWLRWEIWISRFFVLRLANDLFQNSVNERLGRLSKSAAIGIYDQLWCRVWKCDVGEKANRKKNPENREITQEMNAGVGYLPLWSAIFFRSSVGLRTQTSQGEYRRTHFVS
jgi:hypothetical protein